MGEELKKEYLAMKRETNALKREELALRREELIYRNRDLDHRIKVSAQIQERESGMRQISPAIPPEKKEWVKVELPQKPPLTLPDHWITMKSRFPGICTLCGKGFKTGDEIIYDKGPPTFTAHKNCSGGG